jgi:iron complex outermembrane recepter protein
VGIADLEVTGYGIHRRIDNPTAATIIDLSRNAGGLRALLRGDTPGAPLGLRWSAGFDADQQRDDRTNFANQGGERGNVTLDQFERVTNLAGYAHVTMSPAAPLLLLAGVRYDWYRFGVDDRLVTATNPDDSGSRVMDAVSPSVGISYSLGQMLNLYGNVATSFETPTTTELANRPSGAGGFNPELDPQTATSFEAGVKGRLPWRITYDLAAYHTDVRNSLIGFEVPQAQGRQFFRNAGSARHRGVESAVSISPLPLVLLRGSYTYTDAVFQEYTVGGTDMAGNRVPGVSPHRADAVLSYGLGTTAFGALEGRYASEMPVNDRNSAHSPAYWLLDARAGLQGVRLGRLELEPFAGLTNLLDREYNTSVIVNAFGGRFFEPGPGRAFFVGSSARFAMQGG